MAKSQFVSDQQTVAWVLRHKVGILSVLLSAFLAENWFVRATGLYLPISGMILVALFAYGVRYLAGLAWWWNRRRILLAKHSLPAPGPVEMWRHRRLERKRIGYIHKQWMAFCTANNITGVGKIIPKLHNVKGTVSGDLTALISPGPITVKGGVDKIMSLSTSIAETCGCVEVLVRPTGVGHANLTFLWTQAMERVLPVAQLPRGRKGQITFGVRRDGQPASITAGLSVLNAGLTGAGKALALDTLVPTPDGWTTMGDIKAGDVIFAEDGQPTTVTDAYDVRYDRPCYRVRFSDGSFVVADAEHQWTVDTAASRRSDYSANRKPRRRLNPRLSQQHKRHMPVTMTTEEMVANLRAGAGTANRWNYSVKVAQPLQCQDASLPVGPYTLGAWLGDGTTKSNGFTTADPEILLNIEAEGYETAKKAGKYTWAIFTPETRSQCARCGMHAVPGSDFCGIHGGKGSCRRCGKVCQGTECRACGGPTFTAALRRAGVYRNKHIPAAYLRASEAQRRDLLAGLLDTDGSCTKRGSVEFYSSNRRLARDVFHLASSLGYRPSIRSKRAMLNGKDCGETWTVAFATADKVFRLARKVERQVLEQSVHSQQRYVVGIEPVPSVPVRCISVDSPSHLFLVGEACIATHNSGITWSLLADLNRQGIPVDLYASDPKGGIELGVLADKKGDRTSNLSVVDYCSSADDTKRLIDACEQAMKKRQQGQTGRAWSVDDAAEQPLIILLIDECVEVLALMKTAGPTNNRGLYLTKLKTIISQGRASGVMVVALTQMAQKEVIGDVRDMFAQRLCLATRNAINTDMVLGDGAEAAGALCSKIVNRPGVGYSFDEARRGYELFRAAWCDDDDIKRIAAGQTPEGMDTGVKGEVNRSCAVYRFFNHVGELLYVGKTVDVAARFTQHAADKPWWHEVDMSKTLVTWHPSEAAALRVEEQEIKSRLPRYNKQHNGANPLARAYVKPEPAEPAQPLAQRALRLVRPERREPQPWEFRPVRVTPKRRRKPAPAKAATVQPAPAAYLNATRSPSAPAAYTRTLKETA